MRKTLLVLLAAVNMCLFASAQQLQSENWNAYNLSGKVRSFEETVRSVLNDDRTSAGPTRGNKVLITFDHAGNISRLEIYDDNELKHVLEYTYTNIGYHSVSKTKRRSKGTDIWITGMEKSYTYNDAKHTEETKDGAGIRKGFYNDLGETDSVYVYGSDKVIRQKIYYKYDPGGHIIETKICAPDGAVRSKHIYQVDGFGRKLLEQWFDGGAVAKSVISHKYDDHGNESEFLESSYPGVNNNDLSFTTVRVFKYRYDNKGNWILREQYNEDGKLKATTERKIVYY